MHWLLVLCSLLLALPACTPLLVLSDAPQSSEPVLPAPTAPPVDIPSGLTLVSLEVAQPSPDVLETTDGVLSYVPRRFGPVRTLSRSLAAPVRLPSPLELVEQGQAGARIGPGSAGYRQVGAMHMYQYEVGAVYDLYVSSTLATGLLFPPGDAIKVGLFLPKDDFTVETKSAGETAAAYDAVTIHPNVASGTYDAFVLMSNGRVYPFHIIVGKKGMLTVSFEVPQLEAGR